MGEFDEIRKPTSPLPWLVAGVVLLILALIMFVLVGVELAAGPAEDADGAPQAWGALQSLTVVGGALFLATGLLALTMGIIKRRRQ